tara:strand:+ start:145 stop:486 length:342 start_codon:yes stop_codon:yes gene_type:complete
MPFSRLSNRNIFRNEDLLYDEKFKVKNLSGITQYNTDTLTFPSRQKTSRMAYDTKLWKTGDRLYKIAFEVYGDSRYWWVIAQFNKKPTEHHFKVGDTYYIPLNLEDALNSFGY